MSDLADWLKDAALAEYVRAEVDAALRQHRLDWAGWIESWDGAVTPERPTLPVVVDWLRADSLPFGCAANPHAGAGR